ncbi:hypothetical protein EWM64_g4682 [Hericium alpestre]|uniref:Reverse transcriptase domain-containing protein n=1 Tax=Hericium alpestre TaxID=135208 RepID=A0A4Y9ZWZ8_9AGAM|nr:hypothetical protein EWM64_g4682 [Hericium alpestre]
MQIQNTSWSPPACCQGFTEDTDEPTMPMPTDWTIKGLNISNPDDDFNCILDPELPDDIVFRINQTMTNAQELAAAFASKQKTRTLEQMIPKEYREFRDVFEEKASERLPTRWPWDHAIDLKPEAEPHSAKAYPMAPHELKELDKFLEENLRKGYIRESKSPWAAPFFFISKKDGKLCPVQDYRELNKHTIRNKYPLPLIGELIDKLKGAKVFSKFDLWWGYNNVHIKEGDEYKAAF